MLNLLAFSYENPNSAPQPYISTLLLSQGSTSTEHPSTTNSKKQYKTKKNYS